MLMLSPEADDPCCNGGYRCGFELVVIRGDYADGTGPPQDSLGDSSGTTDEPCKEMGVPIQQKTGIVTVRKCM